MFIHSFEGRFFDRPFWQTRFVLTDPADLDRLRRSTIDAVIIDAGKTQSPAALGRPAPIKPRAAHPSGLEVSKVMNPDLRGLVQTVGRSKREVMRIVDDVRLGRPIAVARLAPMLSELSQAVERNSVAFLGILRLKTRDEYTYLHSVAVSALMMNFARTLGLDEKQISDLGMAGLLHDVGKLAMPAAILNKEGALTPDEYDIIKCHPQAGDKILRAGSDVPEAAFEVCLHHHERIDGKGYPFGQTGEQLSLASRMGAICDVYDALTSHRAYKAAWSPQRALGEMQQWIGQFDQSLLETFMRSLGIYPVGTLVRLRESSLCVVVADNPEEPTLPTVRSFYSILAKARVHPEDIRIANGHVLTLTNPAEWDIKNWPALKRELLESSPSVQQDAR